MNLQSQVASEIHTEQTTHERCPGCFNWTPVASLVKYPAGSIADWRDYYLCQRCDYTLEYSAYDAAYNHILDNVRNYDGGAE